MRETCVKGSTIDSHSPRMLHSMTKHFGMDEDKTLSSFAFLSASRHPGLGLSETAISLSDDFKLVDKTSSRLRRNSLPYMELDELMFIS